MRGLSTRDLLLANIVFALLLASSSCTRRSYSGDASSYAERSAAGTETSTPAAATVTSTIPVSEIRVPEPELPPSKLGYLELSEMSGEELASRATRFAGSGDYERAAHYQAWANERGARQLYGLACFEARAGDTDAAIHWLQLAAQREGVVPSWTSRDPDLATLRADPRWPKIYAHLVAWDDHWSKVSRPELVVISPKQLAPERVPVIIALPGLTGHPRRFASTERMQPIADRTGAVIVGVSGPRALGPRGYRWTEDPELDRTRIDEAIRAAAGTATIARDRIVLYGFSQGAQIALEQAARSPQEFAGAIALSPGTLDDDELEQLPKSPAHKGQRYVVSCGGQEARETINLTVKNARVLRELGAEVKNKLYRGMSEHTLPPDFASGMPRWFEWIAGS